MRIPLRKTYRAFPELDRFSDEDCERYLRYANRRAGTRIGCAMLLAIAISMIAWGPLVFIGLRAAAPRLDMGTGFEVFMMLTATIAITIVPALAGLFARDRVLLAAIRDRLQSARCPQCTFSLLGLPVANGIVRCPECGSRITLAEHDLTPDDILAGAESKREVP
jgi:DNA-directed RNA polymerase subunit RPC12/RpoP